MMKIFSTKCFIEGRSGITFIEIMVCVIIASLVFKVVHDFMSNTRQNYMYGTVNLQNLQDARLFINYLRRDFASSCPSFVDPDEDPAEGYINLQKVRKQLFVTGESNQELNGDLIQVHAHGLLFHKFVYGSYGEKPKVERVSYQFDSVSKTMTRSSETKGSKTFTGFEEVEFALYTHETNPNIPVLWVKCRIHDAKYNSAEIGKALELTTTVSSPFITGSQNNRYWRYEMGHEKF